MKIMDGFMLRKVGGQYVVAAFGEASRSFNGIIRLNETGKFLWEQLSADKSEEELRKALTEEYDVAGAQAATDVAEFVGALKKAALLA